MALPELLSIDDPSSKEQMETEFADWVRIDEAAQTLRHAEWNKIDNRLIGEDVPGGFSNLYSFDYANRVAGAATGTTKPMFVPVNRAHSLREGLLGEFVAGKKTLSATGRNPTDRKIAQVFSNYIQYILDYNQFNDAIFAPAIDRCIAKGLDWLGAEYDPYGNNMKGVFRLFRANCRDVLVDASANAASGSFFMTDTRRTYRWKMSTVEANRKMKKKYKHWTEVSGDGNYDAAYIPTDISLQQFLHSTFYWIEFKSSQDALIVANPETGEMSCIPTNEAASVDPRFIVGPTEEEFIYRAHYNKTNGKMYHLERLPYSMFTMVPLVNVESDSRRYPLGDIQIYDSLLDLVNVVATVMVESAKSSTKGRGILDRSVWGDQKLVDAAQRVIDKGGTAVGLTNIIYPSIPVQVITNLLGTIEGMLSDVAARHQASMGELPVKQIAAETVQLLQRKDRASHGRKDVTIRFALTQYAKLIAEMISVHATEEDVFEVMDAQPGSPKYVPINKTLTNTEYISMLAEIFDIALPQAPSDDEPNDPAQYQQEVMQFNNAIQKARAAFEQENDVKRTSVQGWSIEGEEVTDEQIAKLMSDSQMGSDEFDAKYRPEQKTITLYNVNRITDRKVDLNIKFEVDSDYESDLDYRTNRAFTLRKFGLLSGPDLMKEIQMPNGEQLAKNAQEENQALMLAKEVIAAGPEAVQAVTQIVQQAHAPSKAA